MLSDVSLELDVCGLELEEATRRLAEQGQVLWQTLPTSPAVSSRLGRRWRVLQQRSTPAGVILIVAREMSCSDHHIEEHLNA